MSMPEAGGLHMGGKLLQYVHSELLVQGEVLVHKGVTA